MDSPYWKGPLPGVDVQRRLPVENVPGASRTAFRGQPKSVRLQPGIRVRLAPGMLFGISPESCSASPRNTVRLAPEYAPITRRWGICFRSTQRYTVWTLTPRYTAASRTVSGSSAGRSANPRPLPPGELRWGRCFGFMPICKPCSGFTPKLYRRPSKMGIAAVAHRKWPQPPRSYPAAWRDGSNPPPVSADLVP
jgi:hypothetical protein